MPQLRKTMRCCFLKNESSFWELKPLTIHSSIGLPWRMLWYQFGPFAAYLATGRAQDVLALADQVNERTQSIEEIQYWRGRALAALGDISGAKAALQQSLALNPTFAPAQAALAQLR